MSINLIEPIFRIESFCLIESSIYSATIFFEKFSSLQILSFVRLTKSFGAFGQFRRYYLWVFFQSRSYPEPIYLIESLLCPIAFFLEVLRSLHTIRHVELLVRLLSKNQESISDSGLQHRALGQTWARAQARALVCSSRNRLVDKEPKFFVSRWKKNRWVEIRRNDRTGDQVHELLHSPGPPDPEGRPLRPEREGPEPGTVLLRREEVPRLCGRLQRKPHSSWWASVFAMKWSIKLWALSHKLELNQI